MRRCKPSPMRGPSFMKRYSSVCLMIAIAASSILSGPSISSGQQPVTIPSIQLKGLHDRVTIIRDERGIPYIEAKNDADLYFAQGYATASDRLWQMDLLRRNERGELAEVLGNTVLQQDKQHRTLGFAQEVESELAKASPESRAVLEA